MQLFIPGEVRRACVPRRSICSGLAADPFVCSSPPAGRARHHQRARRDGQHAVQGREYRFQLSLQQVLRHLWRVPRRAAMALLWLPTPVEPAAERPSADASFPPSLPRRDAAQPERQRLPALVRRRHPPPGRDGPPPAPVQHADCGRHGPGHPRSDARDHPAVHHGRAPRPAGHRRARRQAPGAREPHRPDEFELGGARQEAARARGGPLRPQGDGRLLPGRACPPSPSPAPAPLSHQIAG